MELDWWEKAFSAQPSALSEEKTAESSKLMALFEEGQYLCNPLKARSARAERGPAESRRRGSAEASACAAWVL
jgi:hypothetical protein